MPTWKGSSTSSRVRLFPSALLCSIPRFLVLSTHLSFGSAVVVLATAFLHPGGLGPRYRFSSSGVSSSKAGSKEELVDPLQLSSQVQHHSGSLSDPVQRPVLWLVKFHYICYRFEMDEYLDRRQTRERERLLRELEAEEEADRDPSLGGSPDSFFPSGHSGNLTVEEIERIRQSLVSVGTTKEHWGMWGPADHLPLK